MLAPSHEFDAKHLSTTALQAELLRRQDEIPKPECGSGGTRGAYNTPLHVFALVLILALSTAACSFPIIVRRFPRFPVPHHFLFLSRHFGTGVLIATAFVHLLPTAFVSLTDPCLPAFWNEGYPAMAGLIAMTAVLVVVGVEMSFATRGAGHIHGSEYGNVPVEDGSCPERRRHPSNGHAKHSRTRSHSFRSFRQEEFGVHENNSAGLSRASDESIVWAKSPTQANGSSKPSGASYPDSDPEANGSDLNLDEDDPIADSSGLLRIPHSSHDDLGPHSTEQSQEKLLLQCLLLEAGILFHSIFIGMALSVAIGTPFVVLLIAISFHQTFEGLALGSRIAAITIFPPSSPKPWLMALAYGTTTPIGQAIGLAVHGLYDPAGQTGLLMVGATNAVSSGLLLFAGLVELLAEDFLSDASYETLKGKRRLQACGAVVGGALLMALVGAWA